jgi:hypothetical protein
MATRSVISCDNCTAEPAETLRIDIGRGDRDIDLCRDCQEAFGLAKLTALLNDFGVPVERAPAAAAATQGSRWPCPECPQTRASRGGTLHHLEAIHGYDRVAASHAVPPRDSSLACTVCGFLTTPGPGIASHLALHNEEPEVTDDEASDDEQPAQVELSV